MSNQPQRLTLSERIARLHAAKPWMTHSQVMAELQARSIASRKARRQPVYGVLHPIRADRMAFANVESPRRYWWQDDEN